METTKTIGNKGEKIAERFLKKKGYVIIDKNFSTDVGEIDIICANDGYLIFVEVKCRLNDNHGYAADAVNYHKRKKINQVASQYISKFKMYDYPVRFDVVEVYTEENRVVHIENAFDSYLRY
ncbi:MAG: YraN family protein [Clostridia bacterium]|nr:YraN family protein [Clostridia bacterium]